MPGRAVCWRCAVGVLPALAAETVLVSDFWSPYWEFELTAKATGPGRWRRCSPRWLEALLTEMIAAVNAAREAGADRLEEAVRAGFRRRYGELVNTGWTANPDYAPGNRRRGKRPKHVNLLDRLDTHRDEVMRLVDNLAVPPTNNGSEQDIRMVKVRLKVCGGLRTMASAKAFCRLRSYLSTARKQGQSSLTVLRLLCAGTPWIPAAAA